MLNYYYSDSISDFNLKSPETIIGEISINSRHGHINTELYAWENQITILKEALKNKNGHLYFEFSIPRMGKRVDCLLIIKNIIFVIEFKIGEDKYYNHDIEQVWDYALDLKNFHKPSHNSLLVPILVATHAKKVPFEIIEPNHTDSLTNPLKTNSKDLGNTLDRFLSYFLEEENIISLDFINGSYSPTPTIIEAAVTLYNNHNVEDITRSDADATNLRVTTKYISDTITTAKRDSKKIICFVTGVPGAGKTLVGLKVAAEHLDKSKGNSSVFLSGNKPLVDILQEALTRDKVLQEKLK